MTRPYVLASGSHFCTRVELVIDGPRETGVFTDTQNLGEGDV
jgi:hypothetical protein